MNVTIISFGHVDSITALSKYLSLLGNRVNLILVVYDDFYINSIIKLDLRNVGFGLNYLKDLANQSKDLQYLLDYSKNFDFYLLKLPSRKLKDLSNIKYIKECVKLIIKEKTDIVHFNGDSAHQLVFTILLKNYPKVITIHDYKPHTGEDQKWSKNKILRKITYTSNYFFILHSNFNRDLMLSENKKINPEKVKTIYYAPFDFYDYYKDSKNEEEFPSAIFFGRISPYKGIEYFCEAIEIVNKIIPEAKFFILGNGKFYFNIDKYLQKLPIFVLNEYIDNSTLTYYLNKSSVTVLPYLDSTQSGVVITSYSFNKPVIATATGGIPEIVIESKTGYLIPPKNSKLLAEKLIDLFSDREKLRYMQKTINEMKIKKEYEFLSWEKISEETIIFYKKCIENFND